MFSILFVILILVIINGFFAASEMALVSIKPTDFHKIRSRGYKNADLLEKVTRDSTKYLSTIQVAITFAGFLSSAFAGSTLSVYFVDWLATLNINISENLGVIIITFFLSFFTLVFGELVPKRIALSGSVKFALFSAPIINIFMIVFRPFVWLLSISTNAVLKLFGIKNNNETDKITEKEIKEMIVYGHIEGLYKTEESKMMQRIFRLDDLTAEMIMTPKDEIKGLMIESLDIESAINSRFSRLPVFGKDKNDIKGVIFFKDLLLEVKDKNLDEVNYENIIRPPYIVHEKTRANRLLREMKENFNHLAFVVNEKQELEGIVTFEDILEEIVGNIYDEHDLLTDIDESETEFAYILDGDMLISDINGKLGIIIDKESLDYETIGEFVINQLGYVPKSNQHPVINIDVGSIEVLSTRKNRISQIELLIDEDKFKEE
jgi:putative hemolysin